MVDASSIELFLESLKSASTISRELLGLVRGGAASDKIGEDKIGEMNAKILEAQQFAMVTQSDHFSLSKRVGDLEKELVDLKDFRREKQNYEFQSIGDTAFVYAYKPTVESAKPPHWLCSTCCDQDQKSILQFGGMGLCTTWVIWKCHLCESEIRVLHGSHP